MGFSLHCKGSASSSFTFSPLLSCSSLIAACRPREPSLERLCAPALGGGGGTAAVRGNDVADAAPKTRVDAVSDGKHFGKRKMTQKG